MIDISVLVKKMSSQNKNKDNINRNNFKFLYIIGKGGFGRVWKIQSKKTKNDYALKEMSKLKIIDKKSEKSINSEREFLSKLHHPFIVNMHYAFQDRENLYLVMDMLSGGDLRYHISRYRKFSEEQTRFFISNMIFALKYIHENNVIHRDIKPENLVLDKNGYVRITDFGIAKENLPDNSSETSGTPGYMAPEVMRAKNHSFPVDFFAIGVIGYEFMLGKRPYYGKNRQEIKEQMLVKEAVIKEEDIPKGWSNESANFINLLLKRKVDKRLGSKEGAKELMRHPWLKYYPWEELIKKNILAPFIPDKKDNFDKMYCESIDKISEETKLRYEEILESSHYNKVFLDFYYNKEEDKDYENLDENNNYKNIEIDLGLLKINDEVEEIKNDKDNDKKEKNLNNDNNKNDLKDMKAKDEFEQNNNIENSNKNIKNNIEIKELKEDNSIKNKEIKNSMKKENSTLSAFNIKRKEKEINNKKMNTKNSVKNNKMNYKTNENKNKTKNNKRPLSHSNSTQEIMSNKNIINMRKYQKGKISKINSNMHSQVKQQPKIQKISKNSSYLTSNSGIIHKGTGTSININNYYTNDIFNAIYNNFIPHQFYSKFNNKKKTPHQRASSVITNKNKNGKSYLNKNRKNNQIKNNNNNNNNINKTVNNKLKKYRTNSTNPLNFKSSDYEYITKIQKWK